MHLHILFTRLAECSLIIGLFKCVFGVPILDFLGHHVSAGGIVLLVSSSARAIIEFELSEQQKQLRRFLGMIITIIVFSLIVQRCLLRLMT